MKIFRKFDLQGKKFQKRFIPTNIKPEKWKFLESLLFFYFGHIFVKFCSNSLILDIFEWPKYPRYGNLRYIQLCEFFCLPLFSTCTPTLHIQSTIDNALKTHRQLNKVTKNKLQGCGLRGVTTNKNAATRLLIPTLCILRGCCKGEFMYYVCQGGGGGGEAVQAKMLMLGRSLQK